MITLRHLPVMILVGLANCSAALENFRLTYDERILVVGSERNAVEKQLGEPQSVKTIENGNTEAFYRTSRVSQREKSSLVAGHVEADGLTLGLAELFHPAYIGETEAKMFRIHYAASGTVTGISVRCINSKSKSWQQSATMVLPCDGGAVPL